jgi:hypothetical protein
MPDPCISCRKALQPGKAADCELCRAGVCRACLQFLEPGSFSFRARVAPELRHSRYCPACFDAHVAPAQESYEATLALAREAFIFQGNQRHPLPIQRRHKQRLRVEDQRDRDEAILMLAFQAVELGYNAVLEAEVRAEKVRNQGYQTSRWSGSGEPALVDRARLERED